MVMGISTSRLSFGNITVPQLSVVGVVASYDSCLTRYTSQLDLQAVGDSDRIDGLRDVVQSSDIP